MIRLGYFVPNHSVYTNVNLLFRKLLSCRCNPFNSGAMTNEVDFTDALDKVISRSGEGPEADFKIIVSRIPPLVGPGRSQKANYLGARSIGCTETEACEIAGVAVSKLMQWRRNDIFYTLETEYLPELQKTASADLTRLSFLRNMTLLYMQDYKVIRKSQEGVDFLSDREYDYLKLARRHYTNSELLNLEKAIAPDEHKDSIVINLSWGEANPVIEATQATYKLLEPGDTDVESND